MRLLTQNFCLAVKSIIVRHMHVLRLGLPLFTCHIFPHLRSLCSKDSIYDGHHSQSMHPIKCAIAPMTSGKKRKVPVQRCTMHTVQRLKAGCPSSRQSCEISLNAKDRSSCPPMSCDDQLKEASNHLHFLQ